MSITVLSAAEVVFLLTKVYYGSGLIEEEAVVGYGTLNSASDCFLSGV